jgi:predicted transcriptional regulator
MSSAAPYQTVDDFIEHAVSLLHEQEAWLAAHRSEIESKVNQGYAAAQRGELLGPEEVHARLNQRKRQFLGEQNVDERTT